MTRSVSFLVFLLVPVIATGGEWTKARQCIGPDAKVGLSCLVWNEFPEPGETATWCGAVENGKATGEGILEWRKNGRVTQSYEGPLRDGKKEGLGRFKWSDGRRYIGGYRANRMHGRGLFRDKGGALYDGFWIDGRKATDNEYQAFLDRAYPGTSVRDMSLAGFRLQDFYRKYEGRLGTPTEREYTTEFGEFRDLTFGEYVVTLIAPWRDRRDWVILAIRVTSGSEKTSRGVGVGDPSSKVRRAHGDLTSKYETASGLVAFGHWAYLGFRVSYSEETVSAITLGTYIESVAEDEEPP